MNIFALDADPIKAAKGHCNTHVVKMPVESAQMMAQAIRSSHSQRDLTLIPSLYKSSHSNHPCTVWARSSLSNYLWLKELSLALIGEHQYRYGLFREDLQKRILSWPNPDIPDIGLQPFALAVPPWLKEAGLDPITTYRVLYCSEKLHLLKWKRRLPPAWVPRSVLSVSQKLRKKYPPTNKIGTLRKHE